MSYTYAINDDEMVVATHGRSFWILDDVTPLRQIPDVAPTTKVHLFKPRPTHRLRFAGRRVAENAQPRVVNYSRADASLVSFEAGVLLDAGANPPAGVQVFYYVRDAPSDDLRIEIFDVNGSEVRSFGAADLNASAGMNRLVWNMRYPGVLGVEKVGKLDPWERTEGAMVLPGEYRVRVTTGGTQQEQRFQVCQTRGWAIVLKNCPHSCACCATSTRG